MLVNTREYELYLREKENAKNTIKGYLSVLNKLNKFAIDNDYQEMTKELLIEFKQDLIEHNYKIATINNRIVSINVYLNYKYGKDSDELKLKHLREQNKGHKESISQTDYKRLLKFADSEELKLFIKTIANTGLRIAEIQQIQKDDLDKKDVLITNKGKTRVVGIPVWLKKELKSYFRNIEGQLFCKSQSSYRNRLKTTAGRAKIKKSKVYPHSFRHYFAKQFIANGGDVTTLQQLLGHANVATTSIYTKMNKDELLAVFAQQNNR